MNVSRIALAGGVAASTVLLLAGTASAHVSVQPQGEAAKGGYAVINFKVPNERDNASTTKLEVSFPTDHPLASVMPQPVPGWDIEVTTSKLDKPLEMHGKTINEAVSKVTWTGGKIEPGRFQQFPLSVGRLPEDADQLVFKAVQTYSNKEVVRWIEEQKEGADEPDTPAPVLKLTAASGDGHGADAAAGSDSSTSSDSSAASDKSAETTTASSASSQDNAARVLGVIGIVIGVAGVAFGVLAGRRRTTT